MGCECSRDEGVSPQTQNKPVQLQPQAGYAITQTTLAKPTGSKPLKDIITSITYLTNIAPSGFKSNNGPTPAFWIASTLVNYPKLLANIVKGGNGAYAVTVYNAGVPTVINVEDSYPVGADGKAFYTESTNGDVWPMVLEKALAQNLGGYDALFAADWTQLWQSVFGVPVNGSPVSENNWTIFRDNAEKGYPMAVFEYDVNTGKPVKGFTILKCAEQQGMRMIALRDILGNYQHDPNTNNPTAEGDEEKNKKMGFNKAQIDPRVYYFYFEDVASKWLDNGEIMMVYAENPNWSYKFVQATAQPNHPEYFEISVTKKCLFNVSIHQLPNTANPKQYSDIHVEILSKDKEFFNVENASVDACKPTVWADYRSDDSWSQPPGGYRPTAKGEVEPGTYVVSVKARNPAKLTTNFTVSVYSSKPVDIKKLDQTAYGGLRGFLARRMFAPNSSWNYQVNTERFGDNSVNHGRWWSGHYYVFNCENNGDKVWNVSIKFPKLANMKLAKPCRVGAKDSSREFKVQVAVGKSVIVYLRTVPTYERVKDFDDSQLTEDRPFTFEIDSDIN